MQGTLYNNIQAICEDTLTSYHIGEAGFDCVNIAHVLTREIIDAIIAQLEGFQLELAFDE